MKKRIILVIVFIISTLSSYSQLTRSINFSYSPIGKKVVTLEDYADNELGKLRYQLDYQINFQYERKLSLMNTLVEVSYGSYSLTQKFETDYFKSKDPFDKKIQEYRMYLYGGITFNDTKRFQVPCFLGFGFNVHTEKPFGYYDYLSLGFAGKIQPLFYITNKVALFTEGDISLSSLSKKNDESITIKNYFLSAGLKFNL